MEQAAKATAMRNGIIQIIPNENRNYYKVNDVMQLLGVEQSKAYGIIRSLRRELIESGRLLEEYPVGRIPKSYFNLRCGIEMEG